MTREPVMPGMTPKQNAAAIKLQEMPKCEGNPQAPCPQTQLVDFMVKGYDDKHRCAACHAVHMELVYKEAGESAPNAEPQFVSPRLSQAAGKERSSRIGSVVDKLVKAGHRDAAELPLGPASSRASSLPLRAEEVIEEATPLTDQERRAKILAKYGKLKDGNKYRG